MCKHIIGIWYDYESTDIITLDGLKMRMSDIKNMNEYKKKIIMIRYLVYNNSKH